MCADFPRAAAPSIAPSAAMVGVLARDCARGLTGDERAGCRYAYMHEQGIALGEDAFKDKLAGETGHIKLWAAVERVQGDLAVAEAGFRDGMLAEQALFSETLASIAHQAEKLHTLTDLDKVRRARCACTVLCATAAVSALAHRAHRAAALQRANVNLIVCQRLRVE